MPSLLSSESSIQTQDPRLQAQYQRASEALREGRAEHARELAAVWVARYPHVPEFRILLREAQLRLHFPDQQYTGAVHHREWFVRWQSLFRDRGRQLAWCEQQLDRQPLQIAANLQLANLARQLGWIRTELHALQTLLLNPRRKVQYVTRLALLLHREGDSSEAMQVVAAFLRIFPAHTDLIAMRDQIALTESMQMVCGVSVAPADPMEPHGAAPPR